jgi:hypothetical protein
VLLEQRERDELLTLQRPMVELPLLPHAADLAGLYDLARLLDEGLLR